MKLYKVKCADNFKSELEENYKILMEYLEDVINNDLVKNDNIVKDAKSLKDLLKKNKSLIDRGELKKAYPELDNLRKIADKIALTVKKFKNLSLSNDIETVAQLILAMRDRIVNEIFFRNYEKSKYGYER